MKSTAEYIDFTLTGDELANDVSLELIALKGNIKSASGCEFDAEAGTVLIPAGTRRVRVYLGQVVPVTGVELDKTGLELTVDDTAKLTASVTPANADNAKVSWTSSDETVATVDENGNVTAIAAGTATITVTTEDGGFTATCTVTVKAKSVPVDKSALEALYKELKDTANDGYTDETWNAFQKALTEAKQTLDNEDATQGEVDAAAEALRNAAAALAKPEVKPADKTALAELVKKAEALKPADYTKKSFRAVETTLKTAKALLADETLTEADQQKIDTAADALQKAMEGLVKAEDAGHRRQLRSRVLDWHDASGFGRCGLRDPGFQEVQEALSDHISPRGCESTPKGNKHCRRLTPAAVSLSKNPCFQITKAGDFV